MIFYFCYIIRKELNDIIQRDKYNIIKQLNSSFVEKLIKENEDIENIKSLESIIEIKQDILKNSDDVNRNIKKKCEELLYNNL